MSYLILTGLVLLELLLIGGGLLLFRHLSGKGGGKAGGGIEETHGDRLLAFLKFEIQRMQQIIAELPEGDGERMVVEKRLTVFNNEYAMLMAVRESGNLDDYVGLINQYYRSADLVRTPEFDKLQAAIAKYQERIENLEKFRTLFFRSQDDLADTVNRVVDLKRRLDEEILNEEEKNKLIADLEQQKTYLAKELNIADHELEAIMANIGKVCDTNIDQDPEVPKKADVDALMDQMRAIEEENDFLQVQIQHLLKQELEQDASQKDETERLRAELQAQVARYEELEDKFVDMEARYLKAVG